jgi:hypothetical protein
MAGLGKPVLVIWHDAYARVNNEWINKTELTDDPCVVQTVGWLLDAPPRSQHVTIFQSGAPDDDDVDNVIKIPRGMVQEIIYLKIPHKAPRKR